MVPNRIATVREINPTHRLRIYFLNAYMNTGHNQPTSLDVRVVAVEISKVFLGLMMNVTAGTVLKATVVSGGYGQ